jgi:hypothetical protein
MREARSDAHGPTGIRVISERNKEFTDGHINQSGANTTESRIPRVTCRRRKRLTPERKWTDHSGMKASPATRKTATKPKAPIHAKAKPTTKPAGRKTMAVGATAPDAIANATPRPRKTKTGSKR